MEKFAKVAGVVAAFASLLSVLSLAGCGSEPQSPPVGQRAPGADISAAERADKQGNVPAMVAGKK